MKHKLVILFLFIVIISTIGVTSYYVTMIQGSKNQPSSMTDDFQTGKKPLQRQENKEPGEKKSPEQEIIMYDNPEYGFKIALPSNWTNYKIKVERDLTYQGISYLYVMIPFSDPEWPVEENRKTGEKYPGYASMFAIVIWDSKLWEARNVEKQCKEDGQEPEPEYCPRTDEVVGKNARYVFTATFGQDYPPQAEEYIPGLSEGNIGLAHEFLKNRFFITN